MVKIKLEEKPDNVKVVVRCRPLNKTEIAKKYKMCVDIDDERGTVAVVDPESEKENLAKVFSFDAVYGPGSTQKEVYDRTASVIVGSVLGGYNGTVFAYGQTGAGKTFTMDGEENDPELGGITPRAYDHIFDHIRTTENIQFLVQVSYLEIYQEEVIDLLGPDQELRHKVKEHPERGVYVDGLVSFVVKDRREIQKYQAQGQRHRHTAATRMNERSSRSHSIFCITVECGDIGPDGKQRIRRGKLNLVDLAGSERQSKTGTDGVLMKQAAKINLSLTTLGYVITALVDSTRDHVPYRDSQLTRLLQDSLGGNTKTVMIANVGPATYNYKETVSTLRYASRAKNITNKPRVNEDPKDAMLRKFQEEIEQLRVQLEERAKAMPSEDQIKALEEQVRSEHKEKQAKLEEELVKQREVALRVAEEKQKMEEQLQGLEMKVLEGQEHADVARQKEIELIQAREAIAERRRREAQLKEQLTIKDQKYDSAQEEIEAKTRQLKKLWVLYKGAQAEIRDISREFQVEREDLVDTIREYEKQLKLCMLMIKSFIPPEEVQRIEGRASWDEEAKEWHVKKIQLAGNSVRAQRPNSAGGLRRPTTRFAQVARQVDNNPRFRDDNVMQIGLEMPDRTTREFDPNSAAAEPEQSHVYRGSNADSDGRLLAADATASRQSVRGGRPSSRRPESSRRRSKSREASHSSHTKKRNRLAQSDVDQDFPSARGLVEKNAAGVRSQIKEITLLRHEAREGDLKKLSKLQKLAADERPSVAAAAIDALKYVLGPLISGIVPSNEQAVKRRRGEDEAEVVVFYRGVCEFLLSVLRTCEEPAVQISALKALMAFLQVESRSQPQFDPEEATSRLPPAFNFDFFFRMFRTMVVSSALQPGPLSYFCDTFLEYTDISLNTSRSIRQLYGGSKIDFPKVQTSGSERRPANRDETSQDDATFGRVFSILLLVAVPDTEVDDPDSFFVQGLERVIPVRQKIVDKTAKTPVAKSTATKPGSLLDDIVAALDRKENAAKTKRARELSDSEAPVRDTSDLAAVKRKAKVTLPKTHRRAFSQAWVAFLSRPLPAKIRMAVLGVLAERVMPRMADPRILHNFLVATCRGGGAAGIAALQALFTLIQKYNLDLPNFYMFVYSLFDGNLFRLRGREKALRLTCLFLKSTHLPGYIVAAFVKRVSRLALFGPPDAALFAIPFAFNLLLRNPACRVLVHRGEVGEAQASGVGSADTTAGVTAPKPGEEGQRALCPPAAVLTDFAAALESDPFLPLEADPAKAKALDSCLWELTALVKHYYPAVAKLADVWKSTSQKTEINMEPFFAVSYASILTEIKTKKTIKRAPLAFVEPSGLWPAGEGEPEVAELFQKLLGDS